MQGSEDEAWDPSWTRRRGAACMGNVRRAAASRVGVLVLQLLGEHLQRNPIRPQGSRERRHISLSMGRHSRAKNGHGSVVTPSLK